MRSTGFVMYQVAEIGHTLFSNAITPLGINEQQLGVLGVLESFGPQVQAHLSPPLRIDKAKMVGIVNELEERGLVQRLPHPQDRRAVLVHLTEAGKEMLQRSEELVKCFSIQYFAVFSPEELQLFHELLVRLADTHAPHADALAEHHKTT
jgi:DNA-binding MarR family transcriptional regulator